MVYKRLSKTWLSERNVQVSFRQHNATADWYPGLTIEHRPPNGRRAFDGRYYEHRLRCAIDRQKHWVRYHWSLGYRQFKQNDHSLAERNLQWCLQSESVFFPVEVLNSAMVLIEIYSLVRDFEQYSTALKRAMAFYRRVQDDFEVKINDHGTWLEHSETLIDQRKRIVAPMFAY